MRKIQPFGVEAKEFQARAIHAHCMAGEMEYWGDGKRVMVRGGWGRGRKPWAEIREPGDVLYGDVVFRYMDHFLPENKLA